MSKKRKWKNKKSGRTGNHDIDKNEPHGKQDIKAASEAGTEPGQYRQPDPEPPTPGKRNAITRTIRAVYYTLTADIVLIRKNAKKTGGEEEMVDQNETNEINGGNPENGDQTGRAADAEVDAQTHPETGIDTAAENGEGTGVETVAETGAPHLTTDDLEAVLDLIRGLEEKISGVGDTCGPIKNIGSDCDTILEHVKSFPQLPDKINALVRETFENVSTKLDHLKDETISHITAVTKAAPAEIIDDIKKQLEQNTQAVQSFSANIGKIITEIKSASDEIKDTVRRLFRDWEPPSASPGHPAFPLHDFEMMQGKVATIEDIVLQIKRALDAQPSPGRKNELPPFNADDEVIVTLARHGHTIIDQLAPAARHYAVNKGSIEDIAEERKQYEEKIVAAREESLARGERKGIKSTVKNLVDKYEDLDSLFDSTDPGEKIVSQFLRNLSFDRDTQLIKTALVEITPENSDSYQGRAIFQGPGAYTVTHSCFMFKDEVYKPARLTAVQEDA